MIEITTREVDGVRFIESIKILGPDDTIGGVGVHRINMDREPDELIRGIRAMGMRKVGRDYRTRDTLYAESLLPYLLIKPIQFLLKCYWHSIRWLYDNARLFKAIPENECFSWYYLTPYQWVISWCKMLGKIKI